MALHPLVAAGDEDVAVLKAELFRYVPECLSSINDHKPERSNLIQPPADCINWQPDAVVTDHWHEQAVAPHVVVLECKSVHDRARRGQTTADVSTNWRGGDTNSTALSFELQDPSITRPGQIGHEYAARVSAEPTRR
jgi:hypothetical protein